MNKGTKTKQNYNKIVVSTGKSKIGQLYSEGWELDFK